MPLRQIRRSKSSKHQSAHRQRGGDPGRVALPPAYWGNGTRGYYKEGSSELAGCAKQHAVSQGVISKDGYWAGPNLYPLLGGSRRQHKISQKGGGCGCNGRRYRSKSKSKSKSKTNKNMKRH
jgi:hypothetical protein